MSTGRALRDALHRLIVAQGALDTVSRPCGATIALPHAYALLALRGGPLRVSDLAARLRIDRSNVSRLCARMEAAGEITRARDPADGRAWRLQLTPAGERAAEAVDASSARHFAAVADRLAAPAAVLQALHLLTLALDPHQEDPCAPASSRPSP